MPLQVAAPASRVVGVGEIADALGTTKQTVYVHIRSGQIPASRVGNKYFVPRAWLSAILAGKDPSAFRGSGADPA